MIFGNSQQFFVGTIWFQEKWRPETYILKFGETKHVSVVQTFFFCWPVLWVVYGNWQLFKMIQFKRFWLLKCIYVLSFFTRIVIHAGVSLCMVPNPSQTVFLQWKNELFKLFSCTGNGNFKWKKNVSNRNTFLFFSLF